MPSTLRTSSWLAGLTAAVLLGGVAACSTSAAPPAAFGINIPPGTSKIGEVLFNPGGILAQFAAGFSSDGEPQPTTTSVGSGSCTVLEQPSTSSFTFANQVQAVSAGTVTIAESSSPGMPIVLTPVPVVLPDGGVSVQYESDAGEAGAPTFGPNAQLTIAASGADVPAFSLSLTTPDELTFTEPSVADGTPLTVNRSQDLHLAWNPTNGKASIGLEIVQSTGGMVVTVGCSFPESSGSAVFPASVLSHLTPSSGGDAGAAPATIVALATSFAELPLSDWLIVAEATSSPVLHAGSSLIVQ